jgi:uncharacterized membrane protein
LTPRPGPIPEMMTTLSFSSMVFSVPFAFGVAFGVAWIRP